MAFELAMRHSLVVKHLPGKMSGYIADDLTRALVLYEMVRLRGGLLAVPDSSLAGYEGEADAGEGCYDSTL